MLGADIKLVSFLFYDEQIMNGLDDSPEILINIIFGKCNGFLNVCVNYSLCLH